MFFGLRHPEQVVIWVVGLVAWGCPVAAIVAVFGLDERTVAAWLKRAGTYAETFHHQHVQPLDLQQVQVDELRLKTQAGVVWIGMALAVRHRLWLGAVCQVKRDKQLAHQIITCVYNWAKPLPLVISFDGWSAYPKACWKVFRERALTGRVGAPGWVAWKELTLVQLVKHRRSPTLAITRWVLSGSCSMLRYLLNVTQGIGTTLNTAYIERLNGTFRAHLACFARRTRCPARLETTAHERVFLVGCLYNFCWTHRALEGATPAMSAGLTDHIWSLDEFLHWHPFPYWASTV